MSTHKRTTSTATDRAAVHDVDQDVVTPDGDRLQQPGATKRGVTDGGVIAAMVAAGAACALLGVLTLLTDALLSVKEFMTFSEPVGPLSGKTVVPTVAWLIFWPLLHRRLRGREMSLKRGYAVTVALIAIGLLCTFPPFYQLFAAES
jgi:hypothetical protein